MKSPRFTVLLPTYNRADVVGYAVESVLAQSDKDFELFIVMDGCTDSTRTVLQQFSDSRIRIFDLPKAPFFGYANRNRALKEASGKFIAYASHDNLLLPDHLELMGDLLDRQDASWGYSKPLWVSSDGVIAPFLTNLTLDDERHQFLNHHNTIPATCIVHTRHALEDAGYWPEDIPSAADWVLWKRIIERKGSQLAYLRTPTALHFSADWRRSRFSGMTEMQELLSLADQEHFWPEALLPPQVPDDKTPQARLWEAMKTDHKEWTKTLRKAIDTVSDRIAWTAICNQMPNLKALRVQHDALLQSRSWKLTSPFRLVAEKFRNFRSILKRKVNR